METIIASCISAFVAIIVCMIQNSKTVAIIEVKMDELCKKQDRYNNVIERTYILERDRDVLEEKMRVANHRIDDLERR